MLTQFWRQQNLGVGVTVPGLGQLTLNLAVLVSVMVASGGAMWVFSSQIRMAPYLYKTTKSLLINTALKVHSR